MALFFDGSKVWKSNMASLIPLNGLDHRQAARLGKSTEPPARCEVSALLRHRFMGIQPNPSSQVTFILPPTTKGSISTIYIHLSILKMFLALGGWLNDHDLHILRANVSHHIRGDLYKTGDRLCVTVTSQIKHFALHGWGCQGCVTESKGVSDFFGISALLTHRLQVSSGYPKIREYHRFPWEYPPKMPCFFPLQFDLCRTVDVFFLVTAEYPTWYSCW